MHNVISIVIRTKNEELKVGDTLNKIFKQKITSPFEVIIVDSGSTDKTLEIVKDYSVKILSIPQESFSFGYSLNYGIKHATGNIICCISAHCLPCDDLWLYKLIEPIQKEECHATYGRQIPVSKLNPFEEFSLHRHFPEEEKKSGRTPFSNANCAFLKKMWVEVKFDEYIPSWEDYLWYYLLKEKYKFKYVPQACVYHSHMFSFGRIKRISYFDGMSFRYIKVRYNIDVFKESVSGSNKFSYIISDMMNQWKFLFKKRYFRYFLTFPFIRIISYIYYYRGYMKHFELK